MFGNRNNLDKFDYPSEEQRMFQTVAGWSSKKRRRSEDAVVMSWKFQGNNADVNGWVWTGNKIEMLDYTVQDSGSQATIIYGFIRPDQRD